MCIDECPAFDEPVCSSNGSEFKNSCIFKRTVCNFRLNDTLAPVGLCIGKNIFKFPYNPSDIFFYIDYSSNTLQ